MKCPEYDNFSQQEKKSMLSKHEVRFNIAQLTDQRFFMSSVKDETRKKTRLTLFWVGANHASLFLIFRSVIGHHVLNLNNKFPQSLWRAITVFDVGLNPGEISSNACVDSGSIEASASNATTHYSNYNRTGRVGSHPLP